VDGHQNLPSDGHEANAMAITESHQDRRSSRCLPAAERRFSTPQGWADLQ
jgi:hypothetical protein